MTTAQLEVKGRPDQVRAVVEAIHHRHGIRLQQEGPTRQLDASTVAVHLTAVLDDEADVGRAA